MFIKKLIILTLIIVPVEVNVPQLLSQEFTDTADVTTQVAIQQQTVLTAFDVLSRRHQITGNAWIEQSQLDPLIDENGGGACPSAAALIAFQAMRVMSGLEPVDDPHRIILNAFANDRSLLDGRLTNAQLVSLMKHFERSLEGAKLDVNVTSAPNSSHAANGNLWSAAQPPDLSVNPAEIKILSYTVTRNTGEVLGRHFVLLKATDGNSISVIDPQAPAKDRRYKIEYDLNIPTRVYLRYPAEIAPKELTLELNTIFTFAVHNAASQETTIPTESTPVIRIQQQIDSLAKKLVESNELRSPRKWRAEGSRFGLPALDLPAEYGGAGWPASKMIHVFKHAGRWDLNLRDVVGAAHGRVLLKSKAAEVRDIIQQVADGEAYIAITITEPNAGSDFTAMESTCRRVGGGYLLNGTKRFNARLSEATHVVVFTKSNTGRDGRTNVFVLPIDAPGLTIERFGAHGLTGNSYGGLTMKDVYVPESHRIGNEDDGYNIFNGHFRYWRLMQTAAALGTAERALEMMADRLETRHVYGQPIGRFTHLQQPLGQHATELKMAYALATQAAALLDQGDFDKADILICGLKAEGVETALKAVDATARAFGGEGYSDLVDIGDRLRDLNGLRIADGTTDVMRSAVVAKTYGSQFWEMAIKPKKVTSPTEQNPRR